MSDLINRQDAINTALEFFVEFLGGAFHEDDQKILMKRMNELPSSESNERRGKWLNRRIVYMDVHIATCDQCGKRVVVGNFCPNCKADMRGE